jgi:hypothetical protein
MLCANAIRTPSTSLTASPRSCPQRSMHWMTTAVPGGRPLSLRPPFGFTTGTTDVTVCPSPPALGTPRAPDCGQCKTRRSTWRAAQERVCVRFILHIFCWQICPYRSWPPRAQRRVVSLCCWQPRSSLFLDAGDAQILVNVTALSTPGPSMSSALSTRRDPTADTCGRLRPCNYRSAGCTGLRRWSVGFRTGRPGTSSA